MSCSTNKQQGVRSISNYDMMMINYISIFNFSLSANIIIARFVAEFVFRLSVFIHVKLLCKSSYLAGIYSPTMLSLSSNVCHCIEKGHRISQCHLEVEIAARGFNFKILLGIFWLNDYHQNQLMTTYIDLFYVTHIYIGLSASTKKYEHSLKK